METREIAARMIDCSEVKVLAELELLLLSWLSIVKHDDELVAIFIL